MRNRKYILVNGIPTPEPDSIKWLEWCETNKNNLVMKRTTILNRQTGERSHVITVFTCHDDGPEGEPWHFRTATVNGPKIERTYSTRDQAIAGHDEVVEELKRQLGIK